MMPIQRACAVTWLGVSMLLLMSIALVGVSGHGSSRPTSDLRLLKVQPHATLQLSASPALLNSTGQWVRISWSGMVDANEGDWIGAFSPIPPSIDAMRNTLPVKYFNLTNYPVTEEGNIDVWLLYMREDWVFGYFRGGGGPPFLSGKTPATSSSSYDPSTPALLAVSNPVRYDPASKLSSTPMQIHLARTESTSEMRVSWASGHLDRSMSKPVIQWSTNQQALRKLNRGSFGKQARGEVSVDDIHTVIAHTSTYTREQMCGGLAAGVGWRDPGALHSGIIKDLPPATRIYYRVGDSASDVWSPISSFTSAPLPGSDVDLLIFGDAGQAQFDGWVGWNEVVSVRNRTELDPDQPASINTTLAVKDDLDDGTVDPNTALLLLIGDISYARGREALWDQHMYLMQPIAATIPVQTCYGNHEYDWYPTPEDPRPYFFNGTDSGGECGVAYSARFPMPRARTWMSSRRMHAQMGALGRLAQRAQWEEAPWYSLEHGSVYLILTSSEHDWTRGSIQYQWLQHELASINRTRTPWIIVNAHRPMYVSSMSAGNPHSDMDVAAKMREHLEPLLNKFEVDLFFAGHFHDFQRSCAVYNGTCVASTRSTPAKYSSKSGATATATVPMPDFGTVHWVSGAAGQWNNVAQIDPSPSWLDDSDQTHHGYTRIRVRGRTMEMEQVASADRTIISSITLTKGNRAQGRLPTLINNKINREQQTSRPRPVKKLIELDREQLIWKGLGLEEKDGEHKNQDDHSRDHGHRIEEW